MPWHAHAYAHTGAHSYTDVLVPVVLGPATHRMLLISTAP
jgi:hypothetical protein